MKTIDQDAIQSLLELDRDTGGTLVREMIDIYRAERLKHQSQLAKHIADRNSSATSLQAHAMKSTYANFGAQHLAHVLHRIETAGKQGDWVTIEIATEEMQAVLRDFGDDLIELEKRIQRELSDAKKAA